MTSTYPSSGCRLSKCPGPCTTTSAGSVRRTSPPTARLAALESARAARTVKVTAPRDARRIAGLELGGGIAGIFAIGKLQAGLFHDLAFIEPDQAGIGARETDRIGSCGEIGEPAVLDCQQMALRYASLCCNLRQLHPRVLARLLEPRADGAGWYNRFLFKNFFVAHAIPDNAIPRFSRMWS